MMTQLSIHPRGLLKLGLKWNPVGWDFSKLRRHLPLAGSNSGADPDDFKQAGFWTPMPNSVKD